MHPNVARRLMVRLSLSLLLFTALAGPPAPAAAEPGYALNYLRKVGASASHVLALPDGLVFSEGDVLRLYDAAGTQAAGSLALGCDIRGLARVDNTLLALTCAELAVIDIADRASPQLVRAFAPDPAVCPLEDESFLSGLAASGAYAYIGLWTSGCVLNWQTAATLQNIGAWVTRLQVYGGHLFTLEVDSAYDEEVVVHGGLPAPVAEDETEVQYVTNDFAVAADKVFSTAQSPENEGLCAAVWNPTPSLSGARIGCLYHDDQGARAVAASADAARGDNVFTIRQGRLRWVKSSGQTPLVEVASAAYAATIHDLGTGSGQYVYAAGSDGLTIYRFAHLQTEPGPSLAPRTYVPLISLSR